MSDKTKVIITNKSLANKRLRVCDKCHFSFRTFELIHPTSESLKEHLIVSIESEKLPLKANFENVVTID